MRKRYLKAFAKEVFLTLSTRAGQEIPIHITFSLQKMTNNQSQLHKFKQAARDLECDESEEAFERKLKKIAKPKDEEE
jgi:hypothetical protein